MKYLTDISYVRKCVLSMVRRFSFCNSIQNYLSPQIKNHLFQIALKGMEFSFFLYFNTFHDWEEHTAIQLPYIYVFEFIEIYVYFYLHINRNICCQTVYSGVFYVISNSNYVCLKRPSLNFSKLKLILQRFWPCLVLVHRKQFLTQ